MIDLDRIERGAVAIQILAPFEFTTCPRCSQRLRRSTPEGHCMLCLQQESEPVGDEVLAAERGRLKAQLTETFDLLRESEKARDAIATTREHAEARLAALHSELDALVAGFVSRQFDAIENATRALTAATARQEAVTTLIALHDRYREQSAVVPELERSFKKATEELAEARARLEGARAKIQRLSELFDELLRAFGYPWYPEGGTSIDRETYLPIVGSDSFAEASSGMQTLLNVAYHVAGLRFGLQEDDSLLPLFLVLDSPQRTRGPSTTAESESGSTGASSLSTTPSATSSR